MYNAEIECHSISQRDVAHDDRYYDFDYACPIEDWLTILGNKITSFIREDLKMMVGFKASKDPDGLRYLVINVDWRVP